MSASIGRNDPCYCGSGRKYKHCHLRLDQERDASAPRVESAPPPPPPALDSEGTLELLRRAMAKGSKGKGPQSQYRKELTELMATCMMRSGEIETAANKLEAHEAAFAKLTEDEPALIERSRSLFGEDRFAPLWFTAADVQRAFERVGPLTDRNPSDATIERLRAAILHVADADRRSLLALRLSLLLADYVAQRRFLDACLIWRCAENTLEFPDESNPCLFEMFSHGYDAWIREQTAQTEVLIQAMGIDPARLQTMSPDDIDAWIQQRKQDPSVQPRFEAWMRQHPQLATLAAANIHQAEKEFMSLLERPDASDVLVPRDELEPHLPALIERWQTVMHQSSELTADAELDPETAKSLLEKMWPALSDLTAALFTPERIQRLVAQLKCRRNEWFAAGEKSLAACANTALASMDGDSDPARNYFLTCVSFASIRRATDAAMTPDGED